MRIRRRCIKSGHRWLALHVPVQFCARYGCAGERINPDYPMPPEMREALENVLIQRLREVKP